MESNIEGYSDYWLDHETYEVHNLKTGRILTVTEHGKTKNKRVKVKNDQGKWAPVALNTIKYCAGLTCIPDDAFEVPYSDGKLFITKEGDVYSTSINLYGQKLKHTKGTSGYPRVSAIFKGKIRTMDVHTLMCRTFYDPDYIEKGLCCLHLDNDKTNCNLTNLKVGTYSENNKQAYDDGINPGNGL